MSKVFQNLTIFFKKFQDRYTFKNLKAVKYSKKLKPLNIQKLFESH